MSKARNNGEVWAVKAELDALWARSCSEIDPVLDTQKARHNKSNAQDRDIRQDIERVRSDLREDIPRMWASTPQETWESIATKFGRKLARLKNLGGIRAIQTTIERQGQVFRAQFERIFRTHMGTHVNGEVTASTVPAAADIPSDDAPSDDGTFNEDLDALSELADEHFLEEEGADDVVLSPPEPEVDSRTLSLFAESVPDEREKLLREGMHNLLRKIFADVLDMLSVARQECFAKQEVQSLHRFYREVLDAVTKGVYEATRADTVMMADLRTCIERQLSTIHAEKIIKPHEAAKEWKLEDIASTCHEYWLHFLQLELKEENPRTFERLLSATVDNIPEFKLEDIRARILPKKTAMKGAYSWGDQELWWLKNENPSGQAKNSDVCQRYANELNALFHGGLEVREYRAVKKEGMDLMRIWVDTRKPAVTPVPSVNTAAPAPLPPADRRSDVVPTPPVDPPQPLPVDARAAVAEKTLDTIQKIVSAPAPEQDIQGDFGQRGPEWYRGLKNVLHTLHRGLTASLSMPPGKLRVDAVLAFLAREEATLVPAIESLQKVWIGRGAEMLKLMAVALQEWHVLEGYYIGLGETDDNVDAERIREGIDIVVDNVYGGDRNDVLGGVGQIYNFAHNYEQARFVGGQLWTGDDYVYQRLTFRYAPDQLSPRSALSKKEHEDLYRWMKRGCKDGYITPKKRELYREWFVRSLSDGTRDVTNEAFDAAIDTILVELARSGQTKEPSDGSRFSEDDPFARRPVLKSPSPIAAPQAPAVQVPEPIPDPVLPIADLTPSPAAPPEQPISTEEEPTGKQSDAPAETSAPLSTEPPLQSHMPDVPAIPERSPVAWAERVRDGALQSVRKLQADLTQARALAASWDGSLRECEETFDALRMRVEDCDQELKLARTFATKVCNNLLPDMPDDEKRRELLAIEQRLSQHDALTNEIAAFSARWRGVVESIKQTGQQFTAAKGDLRLLRRRDVFGVALADILGPEHAAELEIPEGEGLETALMETEERIAGLAQDYVMTTEVHANICKDKEDRITYDVTDIRQKVAEARKSLPDIIVPQKRERTFDPPLLQRGDESTERGEAKTNALPAPITVDVVVGRKKEQLTLTGMQQRLVSFLAYNWADERNRNKSRGETTEDLREYWQRAYPDEEAPRAPDVHAALQDLSYDFADGIAQRAIPKLEKRKKLEESRDSGKKLFLRIALQATKVMRYVYMPNDRAFGVNAQLPSQARELATHTVTIAKKEERERIQSRLNAYRAVMAWADTADLSDAAAGFAKMREILGQFLQGTELDRAVKKFSRELPKMLEIYRQKRAQTHADGAEVSEEDAE